LGPLSHQEQSQVGTKNTVAGATLLLELRTAGQHRPHSPGADLALTAIVGQNYVGPNEHKEERAETVVANPVAAVVGGAAAVVVDVAVAAAAAAVRIAVVAATAIAAVHCFSGSMLDSSAN
jgi:hypothetical protein